MKKTVFIVSLILSAAVLYSEDFSVVSVNAWSGLGTKGFFRQEEIETPEVRSFRGEVLAGGLGQADADIVVLSGINPAESRASELASALGMRAEVMVARSGFRLGPVSLPVNLKSGDVVLTREDLSAESTGRKALGGGFSNGFFTFLAGDGSQIIGCRMTIGERDVFVFSAEWRRSVFSDRGTLELLLDAYSDGALPAEAYAEAVEDAVSGAGERLRQAGETLAFINSTAGENPVVLCGSLNALPDSPEMELLYGGGFSDVWTIAGRGAGYTWEPEINDNIKKMEPQLPQRACRIDYILIRGEGLEAEHAEIIFDDAVYGVFPSNRFGIRAELRISGNPSGQ